MIKDLRSHASVLLVFFVLHSHIESTFCFSLNTFPFYLIWHRHEIKKQQAVGYFLLETYNLEIDKPTEKDNGDTEHTPPKKPTTRKAANSQSAATKTGKKATTKTADKLPSSTASAAPPASVASSAKQAAKLRKEQQKQQAEAEEARKASTSVQSLGLIYLLSNRHS